jgi:ABC-type phosphate transport system ATPase subunit
LEIFFAQHQVSCLCLGLNHSDALISFLIEHGPTETIFTEPNDPRTKAYIEDAFG